jgi:PTS system nitrogen regulatory IIA component
VLSEFIETKKIIMGMEACDFRHALRQMLDVSSVSNEEDYESVIAGIMERESLMSTALGKGVALPRITLLNKKKTEIILGLSPNGVNCSSIDHLPAKIIILFLFSENDDAASILAHALSLLNEDSVRADLLSSATADDVLEVIRERENK